ncbi:MAG: ribosome silencing factor [Rickettsiales bacterium]|jgi:ribosome-associated protein|nr:ribosome silencing factor [Rickettsiales bacterium]
MQGEKLLEFLMEQLDNHKIDDIEVIDVRGKTSLASYLIIGTGRSEKHIEASMERIRLALKGKEALLKVPEGKHSGWIILDLGDLILHLFTEEERNRYRLSHLWKEEMVSGSV